MNKSNVADFITEEIFKSKVPVTIDVLSEILKTTPHLMYNNELMFNDDELKIIRRIIGFFVSTQFGEYFMRVIGNVCRGDKDTSEKRNVDFTYFTNVGDIRQFIEICDVLNVHVDTTCNNESGSVLVIYKKGGF